jgi:hypothetical protein
MSKPLFEVIPPVANASAARLGTFPWLGLVLALRDA